LESILYFGSLTELLTKLHLEDKTCALNPSHPFKMVEIVQSLISLYLLLVINEMGPVWFSDAARHMQGWQLGNVFILQVPAKKWKILSVRARIHFKVARSIAVWEKICFYY